MFYAALFRVALGSRKKEKKQRRKSFIQLPWYAGIPKRFPRLAAPFSGRKELIQIIIDIYSARFRRYFKMASESRLLSRLRRAARGVYVLSLFASFAAFMNINSSGIGGLLGENSIPFSIGAEGSLNVHSCVADFLVSSLRDLTYVTFDQVLPEKAGF